MWSDTSNCSMTTLRTIIGTPDTARILATLGPAARQTDALRTLIVHLGVARLEIPPLRRRADDIEPLCTAGSPATARAGTSRA